LEDLILRIDLTKIAKPMTEKYKIESVRKQLCKKICSELVIEKTDPAPTHIYNSGECEFYAFSIPTIQCFKGLIIEDPPYICLKKRERSVLWISNGIDTVIN